VPKQDLVLVSAFVAAGASRRAAPVCATIRGPGLALASSFPRPWKNSQFFFAPLIGTSTPKKRGRARRPLHRPWLR